MKHKEKQLQKYITMHTMHATATPQVISKAHRQVKQTVELHSHVIICIFICSTNRIICLCICIRLEDRQKRVWFIPEVTLYWPHFCIF